MLRKLYRCSLKNSNTLIRYNSQVNKNVVSKDLKTANVSLEKSEECFLPKDTKSVLEPLDEDISYISTYLKPTFNFAAYINKSETLQHLLKLGVNLHQIEKNVEDVQFILGLKFEDIKEHIIFLNNLGLATEEIGYLITKNPLLLKEDLENLKIRINYLEYKKFSKEMITRIIKANPFWLTRSTQQIDESLGFFQNHFQLNGNEVRLVAVTCPKLITTKIDKIKVNIFVLREEMGFNYEELKKMLLRKPLIYIKGRDRMLKSFEYLHRDMNIPSERIVEEPEILTCRQKRLIERHSFLSKLGRAQYDPKKPNYVALTSLVSGSDSDFCVDIAKSSVQAYNAFLKSL
ncbi:transcription termination factor 3, mitochondrial [Anoplophora glabripennis]|uniref:transcription termination factor 3, mitochondrial n=1 Tax=Anoplophora glabripennis TaxID=217634 RepID=UPI000873F209|nr:transcription termination factor 3, mitochondrial [Anoplophora glabripennis]